MDEQFYTTKEVAKMLSISCDYLRQILHAGRTAKPNRKVGVSYLWTLTEIKKAASDLRRVGILQDYLDRNKVNKKQGAVIG